MLRSTETLDSLFERQRHTARYLGARPHIPKAPAPPGVDSPATWPAPMQATSPAQAHGPLDIPAAS
jgi:hypothetical protein